MSTRRLVIFDTTLRDGEQAPGFSLRTGEKVRMALQLERLGVDILEAGFPIASDDDAEAVRRVALAIERPVVAALARCAAKDVDRAAWSIAPARRGRIHTFIATSDLHLSRKLRMTREACLTAAVDAVARARSYTDDVEFSAEDATRSDPDFLARVVEAVIGAGATTVNLPDTVGYSTPDEIAEFFRSIMTRVPNADRAVFSAHCHDDLGLAVANSLAAIGAGVGQVECTINGIGERAGNASLEEIVMAARVRPDRLPVEIGVDPRELYASSQMLSELTGERVQANKAIVGRNAFAHEAGIHQDGMLKDRRTYEIMRPEDVGVPRTTIVLGKHSGRHAVQKRCEDLGVTPSRHDLDLIYRQMIALADRQKHVPDADLRSIVAAVCGELPFVDHARDAVAQEVGYGFGV
jgi:2-isopropylmalate synthase